MKKPRKKYRVYFGNKSYETWAVSEKQAVNNVKFQLGLADSYEYHEWQVTKVEVIQY